MNIQAALRFPFRGPRPWVNILLLAVCYLIPVIGPLVALGYAAMAERILARHLDADAPLFDFANFTKYLERGVAPFVVSLIASVLLIPIVLLMELAGFLAVALGVASRIPPGLSVLGILLALLAFMVMVMLWNVLAIPLLLRASLLGKIGEAFDFRWCLDFVRRVFWPAVGYFLLLQLLTLGLMFAGMCALCVGMYPAMAIAIFMHLHVRMQLYHLYLDRGGTALTFIDEPVSPGFPVVPRPMQ